MGFGSRSVKEYKERPDDSTLINPDYTKRKSKIHTFKSFPSVKYATTIKDHKPKRLEGVTTETFREALDHFKTMAADYLDISANEFTHYIRHLFNTAGIKGWEATELVDGEIKHKIKEVNTSTYKNSKGEKHTRYLLPDDREHKEFPLKHILVITVLALHRLVHKKARTIENEEVRKNLWKAYNALEKNIRVWTMLMQAHTHKHWTHIDKKVKAATNKGSAFSKLKY